MVRFPFIREVGKKHEMTLKLTTWRKTKHPISP